MSVEDSLPPLVRERLPTDGVMGALRANRPSLYWLTITVGGLAYLAAIGATVAGVVLLAVAVGRAILAAAVAGPWLAAQWYALTVAVGAGVVAVIYASMRWVGAFANGGEA